MYHSFLHYFQWLLSSDICRSRAQVLMLHVLHFRSECWLHCIRHVRTGALQKPVGTLLQRLPGQIYSYTKPFQCVRVFSRGPQWRVGKCADLDLIKWRYLDIRKWIYIDPLLTKKLNNLNHQFSSICASIDVFLKSKVRQIMCHYVQV